MKRTITLTETELFGLIDKIILETSHSEKFLKEVFSYAKRNMKCQINDIKNGYEICPPISVSSNCYFTHKSDKGAFYVLRFLADNYGLSKHALEIGVRNDLKFEKVKEKSIEKGYTPKSF